LSTAVPINISRDAVATASTPDITHAPASTPVGELLLAASLDTSPTPSSLTVAGLQELLRCLKAKGVVGTGSFAFPSDKVTSANLQAFFQANAISKLSVLSEFADCFEIKDADVVVTYTWSTDLEMLLPEALTLYEEKV
jgi:hypothetical protein